MTAAWARLLYFAGWDHMQLHVLPFDGTDGQLRGATFVLFAEAWILFGLHWRNDRRELYYGLIDGKVLAVEVDTDPAFRVGKPEPLGLVLPLEAEWVSAADGKRFLVPAPNGNRPPPYTVMLNWQAGLKK